MLTFIITVRPLNVYMLLSPVIHIDSTNGKADGKTVTDSCFINSNGCTPSTLRRIDTELLYVFHIPEKSVFKIQKFFMDHILLLHIDFQFLGQRYPYPVPVSCTFPVPPGMEAFISAIELPRIFACYPILKYDSINVEDKIVTYHIRKAEYILLR